MATINPGSPGSPTGNVHLDTIIWGGAWAPDVPGGPVVLTWTITLAASFDSDSGPIAVNGEIWYDFEVALLRQAQQAWADVASITFEETPEGSAGTDLDYILLNYGQAAPLGWYYGILGQHEPPSGTRGEPLTGAFAIESGFWKPRFLEPGGYSYLTMLHEIGHGLGLAHPHDGAGSGELFPGVSDPWDMGDDNLNQGVWTVMSYLFGHPSAFPLHDYRSYGYAATPMAFDVAAIQAIYGANMTTRTGDDVYTLPGTNVRGTAFACIWDAGGVDEISAAGVTRSVTIDLREAPLTGPNAAGFLSSASNVVGGFTIANGVVIENATGGTRHDLITGNGADNRLRGEAGRDTLHGESGADLLLGGAARDMLAGGDGDDTLVGGAGADTLLAGAGADVFRFDSPLPADTGIDRILDYLPGLDVIELDDAGFAGAGGVGQLDASRIALGAVATETDHRLLYDAARGLLRWDSDGAGGEDAVLFCRVDRGLDISTAAIFII